MGRYLNPTNDVSFRKLFGTEKHKPLLISFLNSILVLEGERKIKKVEFLSKDQAPLIKQTKTSILDIKCTDERNVQYIVEMQNKSIPAFVKRTQFYVAHSYVTQFPAGSEYIELKPIILLAIANYELFPDKKQVISYHRTLDVDTFENDLKDLSYVFIELPKFIKNQNDLQTVQDKWLYFFKNWNETKEVPSKVQEEELLEAYRAMEEYNWNAAEREAYIKANIALTDEYDARRKEREEGHKKGLKKGHKKGLKEGHQKGLEEGLTKGQQEGREKRNIEIALKMLEGGFSYEQISVLTGLAEEEIKNHIQMETSDIV